MRFPNSTQPQLLAEGLKMRDSKVRLVTRLVLKRGTARRKKPCPPTGSATLCYRLLAERYAAERGDARR
jgi:hypothetical protein